MVDHETLRRWRLAEGKHTVRRRQQQHRQWRERKPCFGAMVQLDGSHHDWFEGRGPRCVLMVMVDDATNELHARFFEEETTRASYDVLEGWVRRHGPAFAHRLFMSAIKIDAGITLPAPPSRNPPYLFGIPNPAQDFVVTLHPAVIRLRF